MNLLGAGCFGALMGWYLYFINRYRTSEVKMEDLVTIIGALGGGAILALFPASSDLFAAYGVGLFAGFFGYLIVLSVLVWRSPNFDADWFLDGRRKSPTAPFDVPTDQHNRGMGDVSDLDRQE